MSITKKRIIDPFAGGTMRNVWTQARQQNKHDTNL